MNIFENTKKVVIKIGSSTLVEAGSIRVDWLDSFLKDIKMLLDSGIETVVVTSGSIAVGKSHFQDGKVTTIAQKQAAAAVGQIDLISCYKDLAQRNHFNVAQVLLSASDFDDRERYDNLYNIFKELSLRNIVPIVNENDSVTVDEIKIGDNDRLAARVAQICDSDLLILLSDIDGLYDKNPNIHDDAKFISKVDVITKEIEDMASGASSDYGTGGMSTKIVAAKMASLSGCKTVITNGNKLYPISSLIDGVSRCTLFDADKKSVRYRKRFISGFMDAKGEVVVNERARNVLVHENVSLLPVGIVKVFGDFKKGDLIFVKDEDGNHIASGYANYDAISAKKVIGMKSEEVRRVLGDIKSELIHVDNLIK